MTCRTRGTVREVSATLVASTTRRCVPGVKTSAWRAAPTRAYSSSTSVSGRSAAESARGSADLTFTRQEDEDVATRLGVELGEGCDDGVLE